MMTLEGGEESGGGRGERNLPLLKTTRGLQGPCFPGREPLGGGLGPHRPLCPLSLGFPILPHTSAAIRHMDFGTKS